MVDCLIFAILESSYSLQFRKISESMTDYEAHRVIPTFHIIH